MKKNNEEITFKDILSIFIPKIWLIAIVAIVCAVLLGVYAANKPNTYTSTSVMDIRKDSDTINVIDVDLANSVIVKLGERVKSDEFLVMVVSNVNTKYGVDTYPGLTPAIIRSAASYVPLDNGMLKISITTGNPGLSVAIAQAFEDILPTEFSSYSSNALQVQNFNNAKTPTSANDKGVLKNAIIGFAGGGVVAAIAVWLLYVLDSTVRSQKKLEDNFDYPILGVVPCAKKVKTEKESA